MLKTNSKKCDLAVLGIIISIFLLFFLSNKQKIGIKMAINVLNAFGSLAKGSLRTTVKWMAVIDIFVIIFLYYWF